LTYLYQLRIICRRLLGIHASTIVGFDVSRLGRHHRALAQDLQQAVLRAGTSPEDEQRKDIWNTAVLGHGRRRVIDFTGISQIWLREALKRWVAEELPTRRGDHATAILQDHVHRAGELSASLRLHRDDHGDDPGHWDVPTSSRSSAGSSIARPQARCHHGAVPRPAVRSP
jgi:hypothetical protein